LQFGERHDGAPGLDQANEEEGLAFGVNDAPVQTNDVAFGADHLGIEKGHVGGLSMGGGISARFAAKSDGGVSGRLLGTFLTWLQERDSRVFVVATANDVERMPPELLRKGRFDEVFFVDLPGQTERRDILALHLARRGRDAKGFDLDQLAAASEGFSGSELEQAVVAGLYTAFARKMDLDQETLDEEIRAAVPLSVTLAERVEALRHWARDG